MEEVSSSKGSKVQDMDPKKKAEMISTERILTQGSHVGRTNRELAKKKVFSMVKAKVVVSFREYLAPKIKILQVRGKNRQRSFRDQQKSLRNYLLRQSGRKPQ
ncbi:unnamed protein product [Strongylus vulgaris]|uniref:SDA1 C-terminal domain-containing protein n=1 Tax=Strongylus vulgaris TaxID=40348 RepID=A0A3P7JHL0_STRVU|nr:unnamed protein product [Strongylus vulgaris]